MKRTFSLIAMLCMLFTSSAAFAAAPEKIAVCADSIIASASVSLNTSGTAYFNVAVYQEADSIRVSSCRLQKLVDGNWINAGSLSVPSMVRTNTRVYTTTKDYSGNCSSGYSYRLVVTYNIDGYTKSYTSNTASY